MKNFWHTFLACLLALVVGSVVFSFFTFVLFAGVLAVFSGGESVYVKEHSILKLELGETLVDSPQGLMGQFDPLTMSVSRNLSLGQVLETIDQAAADPNIDGIYLNPTEISMGLATMEELREALVRFKESGKFIVSYANYYTQGSYYLASVADPIYVNPQGALDWRGMASTTLFFKGALDKLGVKPEVFRVGEFKSAVEPYLLDRMSPESREQTEVMIGSIWKSMVEEIAASRGLEAADLQKYASDLTVVNPQKAVELRMIDSVRYNDEVLAELSERTDRGDEDPNMVTLSEYRHAPKTAAVRGLSKNKVAVVYAEGDIVDGGAAIGAIGGDALAAKLAKVREDEDIKAVVLRVNSPGGSALAAEVIWREMSLIQAKKPLIVSMGDYAASGGYYISAPADVILADKYTLTGSIGVFALSFNVGDALRDKLGVTTDAVRTNPSADIGNLLRAITPAERAYIQHSVEDVYGTFVGHVADGRNLDREAVLKIAGGRVWSGINAQEIGLVDGFGGLQTAIELAADRAGVADSYRVVTPEEPLDQLSMILNSLLSARIRSLFGTAMTREEQRLLQEYRQITRALEETAGIQARMPYTFQIQ
jgi:protease-4